MDLYTVGHSNHPIGTFLQLLDNHKIRRLVDVRSTPYSRFNPQYNQGALKKTLSGHGIEYFYLGAELGGRPRDPACYKHNAIPVQGADYLHEVDYAKVMKQAWFNRGIKQLLVLAGEQISTILCSEADPAKCHRHHLIASYMLANHPEITVLHILKDSSLLDARSIPIREDKSSPEQLAF